MQKILAMVSCLQHILWGFLSQVISGKRTVQHIFSEADSKIKEYEDIFAQLKSEFQDHAVVQTQIGVLQVKISTQSVLDKLDDAGKYSVILTLMSIGSTS